MPHAGAHLDGHQHGSQKPTETSFCHWVLLQKREFISQGTQKLYFKKYFF